MDPSQRPNPNTDPPSGSSPSSFDDGFRDPSLDPRRHPSKNHELEDESEPGETPNDANPLIDKNSNPVINFFIPDDPDAEYVESQLFNQGPSENEEEPETDLPEPEAPEFEFYDPEEEEYEYIEEIPLSEAAATFFPGLNTLLKSQDELPLIELPPGEDLVAIGGDLSPERLLQHYSNGLFPWFEDNSPILWWSPDPRAILPLDGLHISKSLKKTLRQKKFEVTIDQAFFEVIRGCQVARRDGTWITESMIQAYCEMHRLGFAHSVEVWQEGKLVGGIYGIALGGFFAGESMFYKVSNASKIALIGLVDHLNERGFELFDLQIINDHTHSMGGIEIPKAKYLDLLHNALKSQVKF